MLAVTIGEDASTISHLLKANANIHASDFHGVSVLRMVIAKSGIWLASLKPRESHLVIILLICEKISKDFLVDRRLALQRLQSVGFPKALVPFLKNNRIRRHLLDKNVALAERLNGLTALHTAVMTQDLASVKLLASLGVDVNAVDDRKRNALFAHDPLATGGAERFAILTILLNHGASLYKARDDGLTPMEYLLKEGKSRTIWTVLESKANLLHKCGSNGQSALHFLVMNRNLRYTPREQIKYLLRKGLNVNVTDKSGMSALTCAVKLELDKTIEFLLRIGAQTNWIEIVENTPVLDIFMNGYYEKQQDQYYQWLVQLIFLQQGLNVRQLFEELNTGLVRKLDNLFYGQIVIAQLAIAVASGQFINDETLDYITSETMLRVHYEICRERIEQMKNITVHQSLTFYQLLIASDYLINRYVCNQEFLAAFKLSASGKCYQNSYYFLLARKRIENCLKIMQLRKQSGPVICECTGLNKYGMSGDHYAVSKIVSYLSNRDIQNLFEDQSIWNSKILPPPRTPTVKGNVFSRAIRQFFARTDQQ